MASRDLNAPILAEVLATLRRYFELDDYLENRGGPAEWEEFEACRERLRRMADGLETPAVLRVEPAPVEIGHEPERGPELVCTFTDGREPQTIRRNGSVRLGGLFAIDSAEFIVEFAEFEQHPPFRVRAVTLRPINRVLPTD